MDDLGLPIPPVQPETPVIVTPKKKFPFKLAAGALMALLLIGGAIFGISEVQKRQVAEQYATSTEKQKCASMNDLYDECAMRAIQCKKHNYCKWDSKGRANGCDGKCNYNEKKKKSPSPNPSPTPTPTPTPNPSPSPSPLVGLACVDLTKNTAAPKMGDNVTFTCESSAATGMSPVAWFRYSTDNGVNFSGAVPTAGIAINTSTHKASYDITIDKTGDWEVQCRVCTDSTATTCTAWGKAQ